MKVTVLGASQKPERYSYQAVKLLAARGHEVYPVHPALEDIDGMPVFHHMSDIREKIHTLTVYLSPERSDLLAGDILSLAPQRVIFNPGAENPKLSQRLQSVGIEVLNACTLVMLKTNQFDTNTASS